MRALLLIVAAVLVLAGFTVAGGVGIADHLYERAVADCETYGGRPVAVENRLAYECATPYGKVAP